MVADGVDAVRRNAALAALERQGPYALPHLQAMLSLADEDVVMFALQILARIGDPAAVPGVLPLIRHPQLNIAQSAIEALGRLRSREAVPELLALLGGELWLQLAAIDALGAIGDPVAVGRWSSWSPTRSWRSPRCWPCSASPTRTRWHPCWPGSD